MSTESIEVQVARMDERYTHILRELTEAKEARKVQYEVMEELAKTVALLKAQLQVVEASLQQQAPTIEEFITIKHKVVGAGVMGKWVWACGGVLITFLFNSRESISAWLAK